MSGSNTDHNWGKADWVRRLGIYIGRRPDPVAALLCGLAAGLAGVFGLLEGDALTTATLGVLTVVAFSLVRERSLRIAADERTDEVLEQTTRHGGPSRPLRARSPIRSFAMRVRGTSRTKGTSRASSERSY